MNAESEDWTKIKEIKTATGKIWLLTSYSELTDGHEIKWVLWGGRLCIWSLLFHRFTCKCMNFLYKHGRMLFCTCCLNISLYLLISHMTLHNLRNIHIWNVFSQACSWCSYSFNKRTNSAWRKTEMGVAEWMSQLKKHPRTQWCFFFLCLVLIVKCCLATYANVVSYLCFQFQLVVTTGTIADMYFIHLCRGKKNHDKSVVFC